MLTNRLIDQINLWIKELDTYNLEELCLKPAPDSWSMGQLYQHLIKETQFYLEQIRECLQSDRFKSEEASDLVKTFFKINELPRQRLEGFPSHQLIPQPTHKEPLKSSLLLLTSQAGILARQASHTQAGGKTRHPGFGFLNAEEWFQFAEMHFRHHLLQKERIDLFLETQRRPSSFSGIVLPK